MDDEVTPMRLQRQIDELMAQRASEWLETLRHANETERAAFIDWLRESKLHVQEFLEISAVDRELSRLDPGHEEDVEALISQIAPGVVRMERQQRTSRAENAARLHNGRWMRFATLAAGIAALALLLVMLKVAFFTNPHALATEVGEQRTIELPDASVVQLNTDTKVSFDLGETERSVRLLQGEALFKVARDPHRPFRVRTRAGVIQAVGTQFNVYEKSAGTQVSVLEGRVKVTSNVDGATQMLAAGRQALLRMDGKIELSQRGDIGRVVAWQQQRLVFDNAPLEDVVREFNRYNRSLRIELENVPSGRHHYDGIFDATDPESFATLLGRESDLAVEKKAGALIVRARRR
jgi:transmembrane sensor